MRGILIIEPLYPKVIAGKKTITRRSGGLEMVNGAKATKKKPAIIANPDDWELVRIDSFGNVKFWKKHDALSELHLSPRYKVGEVLYLKEPITTANRTLSSNGYIYKFGAPVGDALNSNGDIVRQGSDGPIKFNNKLFMPASAARAFIRITGIRCERLFDISDRDAIAEGIEQLPNGYYKDYNPAFNKSFNPLGSFISLYIFANKMKRTDEVKNIWVWVYQFEYLQNYKLTNK